MNRPLTQTAPNQQVTVYTYGKGGLLDSLLVNTIRGITNVTYNARGQRTGVWFGNGSKTSYEYDTDTFRLTRLLTTRNSGSDVLQDIAYTYDPEGNIVQQTDSAQQTFYFRNQQVEPTGFYEYDALYRITHAEGREMTRFSMDSPGANDFPNHLPLPNPEPDVMQNYTQLFEYDELGNLLSMRSQGRWTRNYEYDTATNRLLRHEGSTNVYTYDDHGNITSMPHLSRMGWDWNDQLKHTTNETFSSYYNYNAGGSRMRKVVEKGNIREERVYLGNYELYRKYVNNTLITERQTLHVADDQHRFALIDTLTVADNSGALPPAFETVRYQYDNHLGSASLELDEHAAIISYEEYHPFGTTSYRSGRTETEVALKRYKYVGKERDEETGLYYYGARYYAAWLARFVSVDPLQFKYPHYTPYQYAGNKPVSYIDLDGLEEYKKGTNPDLFTEPESDIVSNNGGKIIGYPDYTKSNPISEHKVNSSGEFKDGLIVKGEAGKQFIDILSSLTGLGLNIKDDSYVEITSEDNNGVYRSKVLNNLVKEIISGKTEQVIVDAVVSSDEIFVDQFPFNNTDSSEELYRGKKINDNKVDISDLQSIPSSFTELKAAFIGCLLGERVMASQGWVLAHQNGLQIEGDIIRETYPSATNRIATKEEEQKYSGAQVSLDPNDPRTYGGFFNYTTHGYLSIFIWNSNSKNDPNRINKVVGFNKREN